MSGTQGSDRSCVGGGCALAPASVALNGDECVRVPIIASCARIASSSLALWQPSHSVALLRVWRVTEMSVSKCVRVAIIAELRTHRLSIASSSFCGELLVVATEPEPLQV